MTKSKNEANEIRIDTIGEGADDDRGSERQTVPDERDWGFRFTVHARIRALEPRDWSNFVEPLGHGGADGDVRDFLRRSSDFLDRYTAFLDRWRYRIALQQGWHCYYNQDARRATVLRTFAPVVHRGVECGGRESDGACTDFEHLVVACLNHASALNGRTDDELRAAMQEDRVLKSCYPVALLPSGHGWCGTGISSGDYARFADPHYQPGGWGGTGDHGARGVYEWETAVFGG